MEMQTLRFVIGEAQAKQWEEKIKELIIVGESKGWDVTRNIN